MVGSQEIYREPIINKNYSMLRSPLSILRLFVALRHYRPRPKLETWTDINFHGRCCTHYAPSFRGKNILRSIVYSTKRLGCAFWFYKRKTPTVKFRGGAVIKNIHFNLLPPLVAVKSFFVQIKRNSNLYRNQKIVKNKTQALALLGIR